MKSILTVFLLGVSCIISAQENSKGVLNIFEYQWLNKKLPIDTLPSYSAGTLNLSESKGKIYVVCFWYASCPPCIAEIPALNQLKEKYDGYNVEFIAISFNKKADIDEILINHPFDFQMYHLAQNVIKKNRLTIGYPTNLVIDTNLIVKYQ